MNYYLGLGSNLGDSRFYLRRALELMEKRGIGRLKKCSHLYLTEPIGNPNQPWFLNAVAMMESELEPIKMMDALLEIEKELGRVRNSSQKNLPRTIDLDILLVDDKIIKKPELTVPHPRMRERKFVLLPLLEIEENLRDPEQKKSFKEILKGLKAKAEVKRLNEKLRED